MTDEWAHWEHRVFGRDPTTDDLLDRHLGRTGARKASNEDAAANVQVSMLRDLLRVLHAALDDEHVDPDIGRRVIERVIYGGVPQPSEVEQRLQMQKRMTDYMAGDTRPFAINLDAEMLRTLRDPKDQP